MPATCIRRVWLNLILVGSGHWLVGGCVDSPECLIGSVRQCLECPSVSQTCGGDPVVWSYCNCPPSFSGQQCETVSDCGPEEQCRQSNSLLDGTPPGGMCAQDCARDESICPLGTTCVQTSGAGDDQARNDVLLCMHECQLGGAGCPTNARQVCTQRIADFSCSGQRCGLVGSAGMCRPLCVRDDDCTNAAFCDRKTGACVDAAPEGLTLGSPCGDSADDGCEGFCLPSEEATFCTHSCIYGGEGVDDGWCDWDDDGEPTGYCALTEAPAAGLGDGAYCTPICKSNADCPSNTVCSGYNTAIEETKGICIPGDRAQTDAGTLAVSGDAAVAPSSRSDANVPIAGEPRASGDGGVDASVMSYDYSMGTPSSRN